jgi:pimeloyl-ACP methyl ester carboxylesterase
VFLDDRDPLLHVVAFGSGPPVLLVAGWSASWEVWEPTMGELSRSARCIAADTRGTGWSDGGDGPVTLGDLVHDVFRVLDALDLRRCVIAGESLGGLVALQAVARHPSRFSGVCLVGSPAVLDPRTTAAVAEGSLADYASTVGTYVSTSLPEERTAHLRPWVEEMFLATRPVTAVQLLQAVTGTPLPDVSGLGVPAVVVHGTKDVVVTTEESTELARRLPGARVVTLAGAGHAPTVTRPREVADAIRLLL